MRLTSAIFVCVLLVAPMAAPQTSPPAAQQEPKPPTAAPTVASAIKEQDFARARDLARERVNADPANVQAWDEYALMSVRLKDYATAVSALNRALEVRPDAGYLLAQLMSAYTLGGYTTERQAMRDHIHRLASDHRLPSDFYYVFDSFEVGDQRVEVSEFPVLTGHTQYPNNRYHFDVFNAAGERTGHMVLESNQVDQDVWSRKHGAQAAAGQRVFSLDDYGSHSPGPEATFRFYQGEPSYQQVREDVRQVLLGTLRRLPPDQWGRRPAPQ